MPPSHKPSGEVSIIVALMEQVEGLRQDFAKTTETIVKKIEDQGRDTAAKIDKQGNDIADIKERLARGSERMENMRRDLDNQNDRCQVHGSTALVRRTEPATTKTEKPPRVAWWVMLAAGGALAWVGERGVQVLINAMADRQPVAAVAPSQPPKP
jgi:hypothetical protein